MKREILFKAKCIRTDKWVFGYLSNKDVISTDKGRLKVIPETVSQFTGLTDKNGVKIFENDKIKYNNWIGVVKYSTGAFYICYGDGTESEFNEMSESDLEIIGNIHE